MDTSNCNLQMICINKRESLPRLLAFLLPFLAAGYLGGTEYYHHLENDIGKNYFSFGKQPDYSSMIQSAGVVFLVSGVAAGFVGVVILAVGKGIYKVFL